MRSPHPLDRLVARDSFAEIIALLEPEELIIATLRLEELSDAKIGEVLGISKGTVHRRMQQACRRIMQQRPDLGDLVSDRHPRGATEPRIHRPLEQGYICRWTEEGDQLPDLDLALTIGQVAQRFEVSAQAVGRWVRAGCFPNAYRLGGKHGDHRIPERDLAGFCPPLQGGGVREP